MKTKLKISAEDIGGESGAEHNRKCSQSLALVSTPYFPS